MQVWKGGSSIPLSSPNPFHLLLTSSFPFSVLIFLIKFFFICMHTHICISSVQLICSVVSDSATPWTAACQASLSITSSQSLLKFTSIELVMPSNHLIFCRPFSSCPQSFSAAEAFQMSQLFASGGQSIGVSALTSVLPMNIQDWFPLGWTGWISLQSNTCNLI